MKNWIELVKMIFVSTTKRDGSEKISKWLNMNKEYQDVTERGPSTSKIQHD